MLKIGTVLLTVYISSVVGHGGGWQDPNQAGLYPDLPERDNTPGYGEAVDRVKLQDIKVLTLRDGEMTTGRRSRPLQQLNCVGGSAKGLFFPSVVQCYNRGFDGTSVQWECKADMDTLYRFGDIQVACEGYDYPGDAYILAGSCGLEYTLHLTRQGRQDQEDKQHQQHHGRQKQRGRNQRTQTAELSWEEIQAVLIGAVIIGVVFGFIYCCSVAPNRSTQRQPAQPAPNRSTEYPSASPGAGGGNAPETKSFASSDHTDRQYPDQESTTNSSASGSTWRGNQDRNGQSNNSHSDSDKVTPVTRTASGFGGSKVR